jgi:ribosomal protein S18 acetylase RimI-like enzyme
VRRLRVRRAREDEAEIVHRVTQAAFEEYRGLLPVESGALSESVQDVHNALKEGGAILAVLDDEPVGAARWLREPDGLYVGRVAVLPTYRRQGIASALMRFLEDLAPELGADAIRIGVRESLPNNLKLYQALGYEVVSIDQHPRGPDRSFTMCKRLVARA